MPVAAARLELMVQTTARMEKVDKGEWICTDRAEGNDRAERECVSEYNTLQGVGEKKFAFFFFFFQEGWKHQLLSDSATACRYRDFVPIPEYYTCIVFFIVLWIQCAQQL